MICKQKKTRTSINLRLKKKSNHVLRVGKSSSEHEDGIHSLKFFTILLDFKPTFCSHLLVLLDVVSSVYA